jgi:hypothetical protein
MLPVANHVRADAGGDRPPEILVEQDDNGLAG